MKLTVATILNSAGDSLFQVSLRAEKALDILIDESAIPLNYNQAFRFFGECLGENTSIESIKLVVCSDESSLVPLIESCFSALEHITQPINKLHLKLANCAFEVNPEGEIINPMYTMMYVLANAPAFQCLDAFVLENDTKIQTDYPAYWSKIFGDIFCAVPKVSLNSLTMLGHMVEFFDKDTETEKDVEKGYNDLCESLLETINTCAGLNQLRIQGNWIPDFVWDGLGEFIRDHQSMTRVSLDARGATNMFNFLIDVLENERLNDIALMLDIDIDSDTYGPAAIEIINSISDSLEHLNGLSKLKLVIDLDVLADACELTLLNAAIKNPTLKCLDIDSLAPHLTVDTITASVSMNKSLISVIHHYPPNSDVANAFKRQTQRNLERTTTITVNQLLMAVPYPFQIIADTCQIIAQYLTLHDLVNLSRVSRATRASFFSQEINNVTHTHAVLALAPVDEVDGAASFGQSDNDSECVHESKRQRMG